MEGKYSITIEGLNENSSHGIILSRISPGSTVLECGCASGYMTRYMKEALGAKVSIVELNPSDYDRARKYAADGIRADLEFQEWGNYYQGRKFDYILFTDVLEHLRNPESVLNRAVDLLKEDGTIIVSIPNVAHADILVNLLNGRWNYMPLGLLDNTHIHFWAEKNLDGLFLQAGLTAVEKDYTILPPFTTEQKSEENIPGLLPAIYTLCHQPFADVYQFVYSAKKTDYVRETGVVCTDHYEERHSAYWTEPPCCSEYLKTQSIYWKITKPVRVVLNFLKSLHMGTIIRLFVHSLRAYGIKETLEKGKRYLTRKKNEREFPVPPKEEQETSSVYRNHLSVKELMPVDETVSVVIPTFNGGKELPVLLELLLKQIGVREIEIIVVDSGSTDDTLTIAADFGAKIIQITQAEFSHSFARNLGARHASGEYLLFMTQDAKPGSEHWVRDMAQPILRDTAVAVSCREEPRDDCDLLGRFSIWIHSRYMGILVHDRILSMPASNNYDAMDRNGHLNDVACMIRCDVFSQFEYRGNFAEDLDLGLRLIKNGYQLSLLSGVCIFHSHNRPAFYYLKRHLVGTLTMKQILPDFPVAHIAEDTAVNRIIGMTAAIWHYASELTEAQNIPVERQRFFAWSTRFLNAEKKKLRDLSYEDFSLIIGQKPQFCDERFHNFILDLYRQAAKSFRANTDWLDTRRHSVLIELNDYFAYTGEPFTRETAGQIAELFVKHCGQVAGETLASYATFHGQEASFLNDWVRELSRGV